MTTKTTHCLRCGRAIRSPRAQESGYGAGCQRKIRAAGRAITGGFTPAQIADAEELIEDGGVVAIRDRRVFATVGHRGETYRTAVNGCTCPAGIKGRRCYHGAAVAIVIAAAPVEPTVFVVPGRFAVAA